MFGFKYLVLIVLWVIFPSWLFSQQNEIEFRPEASIKFKSITIHDGLSQNWIRCIYQDNRGLMWFGASGGLNRYDGYELKTYSLGNVNVNAIVQKNNDELWVCNDLGVFIYNQNDDFIRPFEHLNGYTVLSMCQLPDSTVWFGTNTGIFRYSLSSDELVGYFCDGKSGLNNNYINTIFYDSDCNLWIGTKSGLNRYISNEDRFESYQPSQRIGSLSGNDVMAICEDEEKRIWVGTSKDGVNLIQQTNNEITFLKVAEGPVVGLLVDSKNTLWVGISSEGGIMQIDLNVFSPDKTPEIKSIRRNRIDPTSLSDNSIFCFFEDKLGDIWIGTFGGGVNYYSYRGKKFHSVRSLIDDKPAIGNDLVNAIWEEERYLWIGTEGGLDQYDKLTEQTRHFGYEAKNPKSLSSDPVYALYKDSKGNLWVGTWTGGLNLFDYESNSFKRFTPNNSSISSENVFAIFEDSRNNLWIGTVGGGLNRYDYKTGMFTSYIHDSKNPESIHIDVIHDINETPDGRLLVASYGALDIYD